MSEKEELASKIVKRYTMWAAGAALIPIPFVDITALLAAQLKMLAEISKVYGLPFKKSRGKAMLGSMLGYILPETLSEGLFGSLLKFIPGVGLLVGVPSFAIFSAAYAWALGHVFIVHFESGGTFLDLDPEAVKAHFRAQFEEGRKIAGSMKSQDGVVA